VIFHASDWIQEARTVDAPTSLQTDGITLSPAIIA
jgi:hypothetical protein